MHRTTRSEKCETVNEIEARVDKRGEGFTEGLLMQPVSRVF